MFITDIIIIIVVIIIIIIIVIIVIVIIIILLLIIIIVVVVVVQILRLYVLKVHPKPGPFHGVIWAMKPRQCISVQFSDVHPISK